MKNKLSLLAFVLIICAGLVGFTLLRSGSIKGKIIPATSTLRALAVSVADKDTLKAMVNDGSFEIAGAKPGAYNLMIIAQPPYQSITKENVMVVDGEVTDVGEIKLAQ